MKSNEKNRQVYVLTYEYSYTENDDGSSSPEERGGVIGVYESEKLAQGALAKAEKSGDYGDFLDEAALDERCGWSTSGFRLGVEAHRVERS